MAKDTLGRGVPLVAASLRRPLKNFSICYSKKDSDLETKALGEMDVQLPNSRSLAPQAHGLGSEETDNRAYHPQSESSLGNIGFRK